MPALRMLISFAAVALAGRAQPFPQARWNTGGGGVWSQPSNWSCFASATASGTNCVPGAGYSVTLGSSGAGGTVTVDQDVNVASIADGGLNLSVTRHTIS